MSAIAEAVGARCGVSRVVLRVAVLGGLVIAGWLLGSGIALAHEDWHEDWGGGDPGREELVRQHTSVVWLLKAAPPGYDRSDGLLGTPLRVGSTVQGLLRGSPVPKSRVQPSAPIPLAPVLAHAAGTKSATKVVTEAVTTWGPVGPAYATPTRAAIEAPVALPPAAPASQEAVRPVNTPTAGLAGLASGGGDSPLATPVGAEAHLPGADRFAEPSSDSVDPVAPVPTSPPPATTTGAVCLVGGTGGGAGTKGDRFVTLSDRPESTGLTPTCLRRYPGGSGMPQSTAQQPSTSPD